MTTSTNPHLSDSTLRPFLAPTFSPIDYLNTTLPSPTSKPSLTTLTSQTQSHISTLSALQTRLSNTFTDLTDDILRTSSRLAYEVELLRGEAVSLAETLVAQSPLQESLRKLLPNGSTPQRIEAIDSTDEGTQAPEREGEGPNEPAALSRLRTLQHVRAQLQRVIKLFNLALSFPIPPSMTASTTSSLVSVQAPNTDPDEERKAQEALGKIKGEVVELMRGAERVRGVEREKVREKAKDRVRELREVCELWKGTGEYKARLGWVEGLEALVGLKGEGEGEGKSVEGRKEERREGSRAPPESRSGTPATGIGGGGFLKRLRDEIYLDS